MKIKSRLTLFLVFLAVVVTASAGVPDDNMFIRHYGLNSGISHSTVLCIIQDSDGYIWFATKNGLNRFDGYEFKVFSKGDQCLDDNIFNCISEDADKHLWIGSDNGIFCYDMVKGLFTKWDRPASNGMAPEISVQRIQTDRRDNLWVLAKGNLLLLDKVKGELYYVPDLVGEDFRCSALWVDKDNDLVYLATEGGGVSCLNPATMALKKLTDGSVTYYSLLKYQGNVLFAGSHGSGLYLIDCANGTEKEYGLDDDIGTEIYIRTMAKVGEDEFWFGGQNGIYILRNGEVSHINHEEFNPAALSDVAIYSIIKDRDGGIWVGTYFAGAEYIPPRRDRFQVFRPQANINSVGGYRIRQFVSDDEGRLWVASEDGGVSCFDPQTRKFRVYSEKEAPQRRITHDNIQCLAIRDNTVWLGSFSRGLEAIDLRTGGIRHYERARNAPTLRNDDIFALYTDRNNVLWIGSSTGVSTYNPEGDDFVPFTLLDNVFVSSISEDSRGNYWFTTNDKGVFQYNPVTEEIRNYRHSRDNSETICWDRVSCQLESNDGTMWFGIEGVGLSRFDRESGTFVNVGMEDGLPSNMVFKILEDDESFLWISTGSGLVRFNPESMKVEDIFDTSDGLPSRQFNYNSGFKTDDGKMYFGSIEGFVCFDPNDIAHTPKPYKVLVTGLEIMEDRNGSTEYQGAIPDNIVLTSKQSSFKIKFSAMDYVASGAPNHGVYQYKLQGVNKDWIRVDGANSVSYYNVPPGNHTFHVKYSPVQDGADQVETTLDIRIKPPFTKSVVAKILYLLTALSVVAWVIWFFRERNRRLEEKKREESEQKRKEETYKTKIEFFTNIAHEIRTPLTLIKIPLQYIMTTTPDRDDMMSNLNVMSRNTDRLLDLVNQLLDFRKMEESRYSITIKDQDARPVLQDTYNRFAPTATRKGLEFSLDVPSFPVIAAIDREAITKVCSNLFTNAMKHATSYIRTKMTCHENDGLFQVRVSNDGNRIPTEQKTKIFEAFYQIKDSTGSSQEPGSGIGLAFVSNLVKMHKGEIFLDTEAPDTSFVVRIPLSDGSHDINPAGVDNLYDDQGVKLIGDGIRQSQAPAVLAVDDNEELRTMLVKHLEKRYQVLTASDGVEAMKIVSTKMVDIVISDVMMPNMNGIELCSKIKSDAELCHIPVIMLTAKTRVSDKIEGLNSGADAYLDKPFSIDHLVAQVDNLIEKNRRLFATFKNTPDLEMESVALNELDEAFLNKAKSVILDHIEDDEYDIDDLADDMCMSRSSLHRKIKGVTGMTPGEFIRVIRLKKAAELLKNGGFRVNEVCMMVGIKSLSYFSRSFQKMFGVLPRDFAKKQ